MRACLHVNEVAAANRLSLDAAGAWAAEGELDGSLILTAGGGFPCIPFQMADIKVQCDQVAEQSDLAFVV